MIKMQCSVVLLLCTRENGRVSESRENVLLFWESGRNGSVCNTAEQMRTLTERCADLRANIFGVRVTQQGFERGSLMMIVMMVVLVAEIYIQHKKLIHSSRSPHLRAW